MTSLQRLVMTFGLLVALVSPAFARQAAAPTGLVASAHAALHGQAATVGASFEQRRLLAAWRADVCPRKVDGAKGDEPVGECFGIFSDEPAKLQKRDTLHVSAVARPGFLCSKIKCRPGNARAPPAC